MEKRTIFLFILLSFISLAPSSGQFDASVRLVSVKQSGQPFSVNIFGNTFHYNLPTSWKSAHLRLRKNGHDFGTPQIDNFGCMHDGNYTMNAELPTNQVHSFHSGEGVSSKY